MYKGLHCYADFHAHSTYSGHAMSSPSEMAEAAKRMGFNYLALTEHVYQYEIRTDIENQNCRPRLSNIYLTDPNWPFFLCGGWEFNNFVENPAIEYQGLKLLGWHSWFGPEPNKVGMQELLDDYALRAPKMDILVHPERIATLFKIAWQQIDFLDGICSLANEHNCAVEINTNTLRYTSCIPDFSDCECLLNVLLNRLKEYPAVKITLGSDAHITSDIGLNFDRGLELIDSHGLLDRVINIDQGACDEVYKWSLRGRNK